MRSFIPSFQRSVEADDFPATREVLTEIGLLLAMHLALAFALAFTLRLCGIA